jgi:P-type Cu2+ transporter
MRFASLILTTPVVFYSAWPFFQGAWRDLKLKRAGMDVPVALGVGAAYAASIYGTFIGSAEVYFDAVTMFVFFLLTGRFLEMSARKSSAEAAESLIKLIPAAAMRLPGYPATREEEMVAAVKLMAGDHVLIGPGESFPADGSVVEGYSSVDESLVDGRIDAGNQTCRKFGHWRHDQSGKSAGGAGGEGGLGYRAVRHRAAAGSSAG